MKKITQQIAQQIIDEYVSGATSQNLSERFHVSPKRIWGIVSGDSWKSCQRPSDIKEITSKRKPTFNKAWNKHTLDMFPEFTTVQKEIINGSLLGDGCITRSKNKNSCFTKTQCLKYKDYLFWHHQQLSPYSLSPKPVFSNKCFSRLTKRYLVGYRMDTHTHPVFNELRKKWYPHEQKIVPPDLILTPLTLAIWFCDDGSLDVNGRAAVLCTHGFDKPDVDLLAEKLYSHLAIKNVIYMKKVKSGKRLPLLKIKTESYKTLIDTIGKFIVWDCMSHKALYREAALRHLCNNKLSPEDVFEILQLRGGQRVKDIAERFGVERHTISRIFHHKSWKHLGEQ